MVRENTVKNAVLTIAMITALSAAYVQSASAAVVAEPSFCKTLFIDDKPVIRAAGERLANSGLADASYVSSWTAITAAAEGPFRGSGDMVVVPVKTPDIEKWLKEIGQYSMGFMVEKLPEAIGHTAHLRVGDKIYTYAELQAYRGNTEEPPTLLGRVSDYGYSFTEITIPMTKSEQAALIEFLEARRNGNIVAQFDVKNGPKKGDRLDPQFDGEKCTLMKESCGAAATSPFNSMWLDHYTKPGGQILRDFADRMSLVPTPVAKRTIWAHIRNPQTPVVTLLGVDKSMNAELQNDFIHQNQWGHLRGLPIYGLMPDPRSGATTTIKSTRTPLRAWLLANPATAAQLARSAEIAAAAPAPSVLQANPDAPTGARRWFMAAPSAWFSRIARAWGI